MSSVLKLFRTTTFRLALIFMALFGTAAACAIGYIYWQTNVLLNRQLEQTIEAEVQGLAEQYRSGGISNLAKTVANRSLTAGNSIYLVTDSEGDRITGNLTSISRELWNSVGRVEFVYNRPGQKGPESRLALVNIFRLKGGFRLIVGRDIEDRRIFERVVQSAFFLGLGFMALVGLGGGWLVSRSLLSRIDAVTATSRTPSGSRRASRQLSAMISRTLARFSHRPERSDSEYFGITTASARFRGDGPRRGVGDDPILYCRADV